MQMSTVWMHYRGKDDEKTFVIQESLTLLDSAVTRLVSRHTVSSQRLSLTPVCEASHTTCFIEFYCLSLISPIH